MPPQNTLFETLIDDLYQQGYAICENLLTAEAIQSLANIANGRYANGEMQNAKIGKTTKTLNQTIRGDAIAWLDEHDAEQAIQTYFSQMHALKTTINRQLMMGLHELEAHFAIYPIQHVYQKHLDQFRDDSSITAPTRLLSSILYLNENWQPHEGGELRLYLNTQTHLDILPTGGKLVLFLSNKFWHEVMPAKRPRISLTGWFKSGGDMLI